MTTQPDKKLRSTTDGTTDWWPMYHHDIQHSGYSSSTAPFTNTLQWHFPTGDYVLSSPIIVENRLYIGSDNGNVYCINTENGSEIWRYHTAQAVESTPAYSGEKIYVGSSDQYLYCLDALGNSHGSTNQLWRFHTGGRIEGSPAVVDDRIYFGSWDGKFYCLSTTKGIEQWNFTCRGAVDASPAVANKRVYIASFSSYPGEGGVIHCLFADNGTEEWNYTAGYWIACSPTVVDDRLYIGSYDNNIYCFDATPFEDGIDEGIPDPIGAPYDRLWIRETDGWVISSPAVYQGLVYIGAIGEWGEQPDPWGMIYCLNATDGSIRWTFYKEDGWFVSAPAVSSDGKVFLGSDWTPGVFYCLDARTGKEIWNYTTGSWIFSSPALCNGKVYVGSSIGSVFCFYDQGIAPEIEINDITGGTHVTTQVKNTGTAAAHNVEVTLLMKGGLLGHINVSTTERCDTLPPGESLPLSTKKLFFGLGRVSIEVTVDAAGVQLQQQKKAGFVLGFLVMMKN